MITIIREKPQELNIFGKLYFQGNLFCHTLENKKFVFPCGEYPLEITYSPRFRVYLPTIENIKNRFGIRIHAGNYASDSEGCVLVGEYAKTMLINSRKMLAKLITLIKEHNIKKVMIKESV